MPGKVRLPLLPLLLLVLLPAASMAWGILPGTRAMGLGGAFASLGDDAWGGFWNPASILRPGRVLLGTEYSSLYPNLDDGSVHFAALSYLQPVGRFFALSLAGDYMRTPELYQEGEARMTVAFRPGYFPVSFGFAGRYLFRQFDENEFTYYDPLFATHGMRGQGIAIDAGIQAELGRVATLSGVARNVLPPDLGIGEEDELARSFELGAAFYPRFVTPVLQVEYGLEDVAGDPDLSFSVGLEKWMGAASAWGLRSGYTFRSMGNAHELSAGLSARTEGGLPMQLDYAVSMPLNGLSATWGRHRLGLSFRLGGQPWSDVQSRVPLPPMVDRRVWETGTDLYQLELWANRDIQEDTLTVGQYDELPLNSPVELDEAASLYAYFPVTSTLLPEHIRDLTAGLRIPRYWIEENDLELRLLRLYRVEETGELERMPTALMEEDETYYYFEADLDRFGDLLVTCRPAELVMLEPRTVYGDVDSVDIIEASLEFRVSKLWMDENRIDPESIGLSRVRGGVPLDVEIRTIDEDLEYVYYETDPISLFQFVIVATEREGLPVSTIYFDYNDPTIRADQIPALEQVVSTLRANPGVYVSVEGHADSDGTFSYNTGLSEERALNVARYLEENLQGVDVEIEPSWYGERRPAAANTSEEGRALNRRVEIVILRGEE